MSTRDVQSLYDGWHFQLLDLFLVLRESDGQSPSLSCEILLRSLRSFTNQEIAFRFREEKRATQSLVFGCDLSNLAFGFVHPVQSRLQSKSPSFHLSETDTRDAPLMLAFEILNLLDCFVQIGAMGLKSCVEEGRVVVPQTGEQGSSLIAADREFVCQEQGAFVNRLSMHPTVFI